MTTTTTTHRMGRHTPKATIHKIDDHRTLIIDETDPERTWMDAWIVDYDGNDSHVAMIDFTPGSKSIPRNTYYAGIVFDGLVGGYDID